MGRRIGYEPTVAWPASETTMPSALAATSSTAHWWKALSPTSAPEFGIVIGADAVPVVEIGTRSRASGVANKSQPGAFGNGTPPGPVLDRPDTKTATDCDTPSVSARS